MISTLGMVEFNNIAKGIEASDIMIKASNVSILFAKHVCVGKFLVLVCGDVGAVEESVQAGINMGGKTVIDSFILPNVHKQVLDGINRKFKESTINAVGIMELRTVSSGILVLDTVLKAGNVDLIKLIIGNTIGGKCYFIITGDISSVKEAFIAGERIVESNRIIGKSIIPSPDKELLKQIL